MSSLFSKKPFWIIGGSVVAVLLVVGVVVAFAQPQNATVLVAATEAQTPTASVSTTVPTSPTPSPSASAGEDKCAWGACLNSGSGSGSSGQSGSNGSKGAWDCQTNLNDCLAGWVKPTLNVSLVSCTMRDANTAQMTIKLTKVGGNGTTVFVSPTAPGTQATPESIFIVKVYSDGSALPRPFPPAGSTLGGGGNTATLSLTSLNGYVDSTLQDFKIAWYEPVVPTGSCG
jgi:hypothetical protein